MTLAVVTARTARVAGMWLGAATVVETTPRQGFTSSTLRTRNLSLFGHPNPNSSDFEQHHQQALLCWKY